MLQLDFQKNPDGLVPAIVQDGKTGQVLMLAYLNQEAWELCQKTGLGTYWSRSRQEIWVKGKTSGNLQKIQEIRVDCDLDTVILKVEQVGGAACHEGYPSCFFRKLNPDGTLTVVEERVFSPEKVYAPKPPSQS